MAVFSSTLGNVDYSDPQAALKKMANYIRQLQEELEYKLGNLDSQNFNETGLKEITSPLTAQIGDVEGQVTELKLDMNGLSIVVQNGDESSLLLLKSGSVILSSGTIQLSGLVSFSDLAGNGTTTINGANIKTGKISADRIEAGTLDGFEITSEAQGMSTGSAYMGNGYIAVKDHNGYSDCELFFDGGEGKFYLDCSGILGIKSGGNMAITAGEGSSNIYLSCDHLYLNGSELGA